MECLAARCMNDIRSILKLAARRLETASLLRCLNVVIVAAAKVGGIAANDSYPADFMYDNLAIETNVIHAAWRTGVAKLLLLGSQGPGAAGFRGAVEHLKQF